MAETPVKTIPATRLAIRPLAASEIPILLSLIGELAEFERMSPRVTATEEKMRSALFGPHPFAEALLGWLDREPIAYAVIHHTFSTFAALPGLYIEDIYVRLAHRSRGYGEELMRHLARLAARRGCAALSWSVLGWNEAAIRFYRNLGAEQVTEWDAYKLSGDALRQLGEDRVRW